MAVEPMTVMPFSIIPYDFFFLITANDPTFRNAVGLIRDLERLYLMNLAFSNEIGVFVGSVPKSHR
jgi:hypothetical protein